MKKIPLIAWIAFAVTVFLGSALFGVLGAMSGEPIGIVGILSPLGLGIAVLFVVASLATNRAVRPATPTERAAALAFAPPAGQALLYVYREGFIGKAVGVDLSLDGAFFAQIKSPRFTCVVVGPGAHVLKAEFGGLAGTQNKPAEVPFQVAADEVRIVRVTISMGMLKNQLTAVEQPDSANLRQGIANLAMTRPEPI